MRITVLGSGQDGGLPQVGADHDHDVRAREGALLERTASSLLVEIRGKRLLLDVGPDFRAQWLSRPGLPDALALTHAHVGHIAGLLSFGREMANAPGIRCHMTQSMLRFLERNEPWRTLLASGNLDPTLVNPYRCDEYELRLIPVPHRAEHTDTVAISIDNRLLYLPDIDDWDLWPLAESVIASHEIAFLDATFWSEDELPDRRDSVPHPSAFDTLRRFGGLDVDVVLTHMNHTNPLVDPASSASRAVADAGWRVAWDGMTVDSVA